MRNQPIEQANRSTQIIVRDTAAGISLYPKDELGGSYFEEFVNSATIRVELVRKSQPNSVLYNMTLKDLYQIWNGFYKTPKGVVLPFALKDNLLLNKDSYLQIDIKWTAVITVKDLKIQTNTLATSTNVPISFKKIKVEGELEIDTEYFEYLFIPEEVEKIETFIDGYEKKLTSAASLSNATSRVLANSATDMSVKANSTGVEVTGHCGCDDVVKRQKIEMDFNYLSYMSNMPTAYSVLYKTLPNQKIKVFGDAEITLMQA